MDIKFWPTITSTVVGFTKQEISDMNVGANSAKDVAERAVLHAYNVDAIELEDSPVGVVVKDVEFQKELTFSVAIKLQPIVSAQQIP